MAFSDVRTGRNVVLPRFLAALAVLFMFTLPMNANVIVPGQTGVLPDVFTVPPGFDPPILGDLSGTWELAGAHGTWEETVLIDPLGLTCAGCLDFAFQFSVDPNVPLALYAMGLFPFSNDLMIDAGYVAGSGDRAPIAVSRGFGGNVNFLFTTQASAVGPGQVSDFLVVATNARAYNSNGQLSFSGTDGNQINHQGFIDGVFVPAAATPEPSTSLLLVLGLIGFGAFRKRLAARC